MADLTKVRFVRPKRPYIVTIQGLREEDRSDTFDRFEEECKKCLEKGLVRPAYDYVLKCSHLFIRWLAYPRTMALCQSPLNKPFSICAREKNFFMARTASF